VTLGAQSVDVEREGVARWPRADGGRQVRGTGLERRSGHHAFEQGAAAQPGLAREKAHLHGAGGFDLDDAQALDRREDRRQAEPSVALDDDRARRTGRRADAPVEEGQRRARGAADHCPCAAAFGDPSRVFERVDVVHRGQAERLAQRPRVGVSGRTVEPSAHDEPGASDHDRLERTDEEQVEHEVSPEAVGVRRVLVEVIMGEVIGDPGE
jgi:hypothetical protein